MKKTRILALLLCLAMVVSCFAGCSGSEETTTETTTTETKTEEKTEETKEEVKEEAAVQDFTGETVTIGLKQSSNVENYDTNDFTVYIEEQTGINLEFVYFDSTDWKTQVTLMMTSGETLPDILWGLGFSNTERSQYGKDGYFLDLTPYLENSETYQWAKENLILDQGRRDLIDIYGKDAENGAMYGAPSMVYSPNTVTNHTYFNKNWLEIVGKDVPTTVDELYDLLVAFRDTDCNGNGVKDEIPMVTRMNGYCCDGIEWIINAFVFMDDQYTFNVDDGQLWIPYNTDEYREALKFIRKLVEEGLLYEGSFSITNDKDLTAFITPTDGFEIAGAISGQPDIVIEQGNMMVYDYAGVGPLAGETEKGGFQPQTATGCSFNTFITCDAKNPDAAWRVMEEMYTEEAFVRMRYGAEGDGWNWLEEGAEVYGSWGSKQGIPLKIDLFDNSFWAEQNNTSWHTLACTLGNYIEYQSALVDDGSWGAGKTTIFQDTVGKWNDFGNLREEYARNLIYTEEENAVVTEYLTPINDYADEYTALFCTGALDINDDAAWESYVSAYEAMGLNELLAAAQSAYDRMYK